MEILVLPIPIEVRACDDDGAGGGCSYLDACPGLGDWMW